MEYQLERCKTRLDAQAEASRMAADMRDRDRSYQIERNTSFSHRLAEGNNGPNLRVSSSRCSIQERVSSTVRWIQS